jgi:pimeloyl-ACP methyl ester carboxylesterase
VAGESRGHGELLLAVALEREVDERSSQRGQLERRGAAALDDREIARGEVFVQARNESPHLDAGGAAIADGSSRGSQTSSIRASGTRSRMSGHALAQRPSSSARPRCRELVPGAREATRAVVAAGLSERAFHRRRVGYGGPVTVLWGDRDRLVPPRHRDGVRTAFPHAELLLWSRMGHHPQRERPGELLALLDQDAGEGRAASEGRERAA